MNGPPPIAAAVAAAQAATAGQAAAQAATRNAAAIGNLAQGVTSPPSSSAATGVSDTADGQGGG